METYGFDHDDVIQAIVDDTVQEEVEVKAPAAINGAIAIYLQNASKNKEAFNVLPAQLVSKLHSAYCRKNNLIPEKVQFKFDGELMNMSHTIESYDLDDEDLIDVKFLSGAEASQPQGPKIAVYIQSLLHRERERYNVPISCEIGKIVDAYASNHELNPKKVTLKMDGKKLNRKKTLAFYDIEGDDVLDALISK